MSSWRDNVLSTVAKKAGGASEDTRHTPRLPFLTGRLAWIHWRSERLELVMRWIACLREGWDTDGEHRSICKTFGALKDALKSISASCEAMELNLSTALERSSQRLSQVLSRTGPWSRGAPNRVVAAMSTLLNDWSRASLSCRSLCVMSSNLLLLVVAVVVILVVLFLIGEEWTWIQRLFGRSFESVSCFYWRTHCSRAALASDKLQRSASSSKQICWSPVGASHEHQQDDLRPNDLQLLSCVHCTIFRLRLLAQLAGNWIIKRCNIICKYVVQLCAAVCKGESHNRASLQWTKSFARCRHWSLTEAVAVCSGERQLIDSGAVVARVCVSMLGAGAWRWNDDDTFTAPRFISHVTFMDEINVHQTHLYRCFSRSIKAKSAQSCSRIVSAGVMSRLTPGGREESPKQRESFSFN